MNVLVLAAGYATRLYPLTLDKAKPLLPVAGKPLIEWVLQGLQSIENREKTFIVTNHKFAADFQQWAADYQKRHPDFSFKLINDGSNTDADKLGAIGDIHYVVNKENLFARDLLVVAGDNLFSEPVDAFVAYAKTHPATLALYDVGDLEAVKNYNTVEIDQDGLVTFFKEKPEAPRGTLTGIALYYYRKDILPMINTYMADGNNPDQPGRLIQWLYTRIPVQTWRLPGTWCDVGSEASLAKADSIFRQLGSS